MCCMTHADRDAQEPESASLLTDDPMRQCQCKFSSSFPCKRGITGEDLLCDWCREKDPRCYEATTDCTGHYQWCYTHPTQLANPPMIDQAPVKRLGEYAQEPDLSFNEMRREYFQYGSDEFYETGKVPGFLTQEQIEQFSIPQNFEFTPEEYRALERFKDNFYKKYWPETMEGPND